ncbi:CPBP family intramembrane glutamic endopeptidase [Calidifontibacillus oryziterrae]|uniref:CPBP family intramembrane glutamic endopeptidase n=1 Tax=Calidifontibacillus oryziterrae TaxID=1191699 RepID=UPI0002E99F18|nr:CPBP family intramembrane glutamic endopeptidase [Calidifontibacillus oryziterrae]
MGNRQVELIQNMKDKEVLFHLYFTQFSILLLAIVLGFFLFGDLASFLHIWKWDIKEILLFGGGSAIIVIGIDVILMKVLPREMYDDGGINEKVFKNRPVWHSFIICMLVAFSEEFFFRGMIQTHFGLIIASSIFAILHIRYLYKWVLFTAVVSLSFFIGWIYELTANINVTIFMHFLIDFASALILRFQKTRNVS